MHVLHIELPEVDPATSGGPVVLHHLNSGLLTPAGHSDSKKMYNWCICCPMQASNPSSGSQDGSSGFSAAAGAPDGLASHNSAASAALGLQVATQYSEMLQRVQDLLNSVDPSQVNG
jgi:hypothetical protein